MQKGLFLTVEGVDGAGKSSHIAWLQQAIQQLGYDVVVTREPGGTVLGEKLRELLLHEPMHLKTEALLMFAARNEHLQQVILPALSAGKWVLCDRFSDASYAYQGGGRQLGGVAIEQLEQWVHPDVQPDRTWLFDLPLEIARERLERTRDLDRFEQEQSDFFERTRAAYLHRAEHDSQRFCVIDSSQTIEQIRLELEADLQHLHQASRK
ncbi:dTMP kinase [Paenalcaligenes sp. Me131]|uniref:dTMP kinase n=1 Tax=Paenalcaligenes sp. Me131 TaxID=3392636 RepID=UPI003D26E056